MTADELLALARKYVGTEDEARQLADSTRRFIELRFAASGRKCRSCKEVLPVTSFGADSRQPDGLRLYCKECRAAKGI